MSTSLHTNPRLNPILVAKGRIPPLPSPYVPRPHLVTAVVGATRTHRLVVLAAGAFAGKTTLLTESARAPGIGRVYWYSVDEIDATAETLLAGLTHAVHGIVPPVGDELHLLGTLIGVLEAQLGRTVLILDDIHRAAAVVEVVDRLLRYLPPCTCLLLSGRPTRSFLPPLYHWLDDRGQVAHIGAADLRLDEDEQARFRERTGRIGGEWAVGYRPGGRLAVIDGLSRSVLPLLESALAPLVDQLAVLSGASVDLLAAALDLSVAEVNRRLTILRDETVLVEQVDATYYRLNETAREAALARLDEATVAALRQRAATRLALHDPAEAAHLHALSGNVDAAIDTARRVSWWEWRQRYAAALALAKLLPPTALRQAPALALVVAYRHLVEKGPDEAHALIRALRPIEPVERVERVRLLAHCCAARSRTWSLGRCVIALESLVVQHGHTWTARAHAYGMLALGITRGLSDDPRGATESLRSCADMLMLDGGDDAQIREMRLSTCRALAVAERRLGHLDLAEQLYANAEEQARIAGIRYVQLELANNRAVLLQQRGAHVESMGVLQGALASPWSMERGLRPLLHASLADAAAAQGDRVGASQALHAAMMELQDGDIYGLRGHVHAMRALLLAESGHAVAAEIEIAAGAPGWHAATQLARAILQDPHGEDARPALLGALNAADVDRPLRAQARAHLARVYALQGNRPQARMWADAVVLDRSYPLTPREAAILGPRTRRVRQTRVQIPPVSAPMATIVVRFFGAPMLYIAGQSLGNAWWMQSKGRELLWYALAHGSAGFTREEAGADLFPEMDAETSSRALRNLLYELRKLLRTQCGVETILMPAAGRLRLLPEELGRSWDADTRTLEQSLAHLHAGELDAVENLPLLLAGHYLADLQEDWTRPFRYYWEREAIHALDLAAAQYERTGRAVEALTSLRRELEFCPDDTALVQRVMHLYHATGDLGGLRAIYLAHRRALRDDVGADPDPDVVALYRALTSS